MGVEAERVFAAAVVLLLQDELVDFFCKKHFQNVHFNSFNNIEKKREMDIKINYENHCCKKDKTAITLYFKGV